MSEEDTSGSLPPNEAREVDPEKVRELLRNALRACLDVLSDTDPPNMWERPIHHPQEDGFRSKNMVLPHYALGVGERTKDAILTDEVQTLLNYLWGHGREQRTFGSDATRDAWEKSVFRDIILTPLSHALETASINEAVTTGEITPWQLPENVLEWVVDDLAWHIHNGGCRYVARCLIASIRGEPGEVLDLGQGVCLRFHTKEERLKYLCQNTRDLPWHLDPRDAMWERHPILEIPLTISRRQLEEGPTETIQDTVSSQVGDALDLVKWALMVATEQKNPLTEGKIFFECYSGRSSCSLINRHQIKRQITSQSTVYDRPGGRELDTVRELLKHTPKVRDQSNSVDDALWHFGRSCLAELPRDQLLDAAIGLEHLLIHGRSSGHQLQLYGAAVMATTGDESEILAEKLSDIWDSRGTVAHSSQRDVGLAGEARRLLARAIFSIMQLVRDGELRPAQQNIPEEIQNRVLREIPFRSEGSDG